MDFKDVNVQIDLYTLANNCKKVMF